MRKSTWTFCRRWWCGVAAVVALVGPLAPGASAACTFTDCDSPFTGSREELLATDRVTAVEQGMLTILATPFTLRRTVRVDGALPGVRSTVASRDGITRIVTIPAGTPHGDQPPARVTYLDANHRCTRSIATTRKDAWTLLAPPKATAIVADRNAQWRCAKRGAGDLDGPTQAAGFLPSAQVQQAPPEAWFVDYTLEPGFHPPVGLSLGLYWPGQWRAYTRDGAGFAVSSFTADALAASGQERNFAETNAQLRPGGVPVLPQLAGLPGFRRN